MYWLHIAQFLLFLSSSAPLECALNFVSRCSWFLNVNCEEWLEHSNRFWEDNSDINLVVWTNLDFFGFKVMEALHPILTAGTMDSGRSSAEPMIWPFKTNLQDLDCDVIFILISIMSPSFHIFDDLKIFWDCVSEFFHNSPWAEIDQHCSLFITGGRHPSCTISELITPI